MVKRKLRSTEWFGGNGMNAFMHRSWMKNQGLPADVFDGRPVIGICNTWSELTPCNAHLRSLADHVKRGVYEAGGVPFEFPVMSLGESNLRPTASSTLMPSGTTSLPMPSPAMTAILSLFVCCAAMVFPFPT